MLRYTPFFLIILIAFFDIVTCATSFNANQTVAFLNQESKVWTKFGQSSSSTTNSPWHKLNDRPQQSGIVRNHDNNPTGTSKIPVPSQNSNQSPQSGIARNNNQNVGFSKIPVPSQNNPNTNRNVSLGEILNDNRTYIPPKTFYTNPIPGYNSDDDQNERNGNRTDKKRIEEDEELRTFSENLLRRDTNNAARFVTINVQGKTSSGSQKDEAPQPLLVVSNEIYNIPTIGKFTPLYDNYILETNQNEHITPIERDEENKLLDTVLGTTVMQMTRNFLIEKGKIGKDPRDFKDVLKQIWFGMYSRGGGRIGSSGFEHVFLGELKGNTVSGFHDWIYFHEQEKKNHVDYLGYMKKIDFGKGAILKFHMKFHNVNKPVGTMFIGTSPEFEMALYTTCFMLRANDVCPLRLGSNNFIVRTFSFRYRGKNYIGSAFPEI